MPLTLSLPDSQFGIQVSYCPNRFLLRSLLVAMEESAVNQLASPDEIVSFLKCLDD
jgi:hypothetical protein